MPNSVAVRKDLSGTVRFDTGKLNMKSAGYGAPVEMAPGTAVRRARLRASAVTRSPVSFYGLHCLASDRNSPTRFHPVARVFRLLLSRKWSSYRIFGRPRCKAVVDRCRLLISHLRGQRLVLLHSECRLIERVTVGDLIRRKSLLKKPLDKFAPLPRGDCSPEPPDGVSRKLHQQ